jgi:hypothetical protein
VSGPRETRPDGAAVWVAITKVGATGSCRSRVRVGSQKVSHNCRSATPRMFASRPRFRLWHSTDMVTRQMSAVGGWCCKSPFWLADALRRRRRERPHRFTQERPRTFVAALWSLAAIETSKIRPSRDFWTGVKKDANEPAVIGLFGIAPVQFELVDPAKPRWRKL